MKLNQSQSYYINHLLKHKKISPNKLNNTLIKQHIDLLESPFTQLNENKDFDIDLVCKVFTPDFSETEIKGSGITFTPINIVKFMYEHVLEYPFEILNSSKIADISVGNGAFFVGLLIYLKKMKPDFSIVSFIESNLFGYDIKEENIESLKLVLSLLAIYYDEDVEEIKFNFNCCDFLDVYLEQSNNLYFDIIVGNPPYVKQQNIDKDYRSKLEHNFHTIYSNYNLYYAFIEMATKLISDNGKILLLVPNYILKIKSATKLRSYLLTQNFFEKVVDFKFHKLFDGIDTYSMILQLSKNSDTFLFKTATDNSLTKLKNDSWQSIPLSINNIDSINLTNNEEKRLIHQVSIQPNELEISTGIATQKDKLYLIDEVENLDNQNNFFKVIQNTKYPIESDIVKKIIKGSGTSKSGKTKEQYIIFPYEFDKKNTIKLIPLDKLKKRFPLTYEYFTNNKDEFFKRSAILTEENWYQYGRTQSLKKDNPKIIFPTNTDKPKFKFFKDKALFYNGYAIFGIKNHFTTEKEMHALSIILNSDIVDIFMNLTSYYIGGGYLSYQKKYIEKFRVPSLSKENIDVITNLSDRNALNHYIFELYNLSYTDFENYFN